PPTSRPTGCRRRAWPRPPTGRRSRARGTRRPPPSRREGSRRGSEDHGQDESGREDAENRVEAVHAPIAPPPGGRVNWRRQQNRLPDGMRDPTSVESLDQPRGRYRPPYRTSGEAPARAPATSGSTSVSAK